MARRALTDRLLKSLKKDVTDAIVPGLAVRVSSTGQKTFVLVGRFPGRSNPTRRAIGAYPAISDFLRTGPAHGARLDCPGPARD